MNKIKSFSTIWATLKNANFYSDHIFYIMLDKRQMKKNQLIGKFSHNLPQ